MKVKAKAKGVYLGKLYDPDKAKRQTDLEFELIERKGKDVNGKPVTLKPQDQFSERWMEKVTAKKAKAE